MYTKTVALRVSGMRSCLSLFLWYRQWHFMVSSLRRILPINRHPNFGTCFWFVHGQFRLAETFIGSAAIELSAGNKITLIISIIQV
jgi:hypothetical protein